MYELICGLILLAWGIWSIIAIFKGRKVQWLIQYNEEFLPKQILGKYYDAVMNFLFGTISLVGGLYLIVAYFR